MGELGPKHQRLSPRERQIAEAYAAGRSYREIAELLFIAPTTVRTHLGTIYRKLGVSNKIALLRALETTTDRSGTDVSSSDSVGSDRAGGAEGASQSLAPAMGPLAERRHLTISSVALMGSMELSTQLDPEQMQELLADYQKAIAKDAARFQGHVANVMGDGMLLSFGWPNAHEDDAERAVRASLAIRESAGVLRGPGDNPLAVRIGIASGLVVVSEGMGHDALAGDAPNLASRLRELAGPGQVVIAESTRHLLGDIFELADLGTKGVEGIAEPIQTFAVTCERPVESRFDALHGEHFTPLVGRDQELALLVERWELAKAGEGQGVLLLGEAGIGKSRIARALLDAMVGEPHIRIRYQCSPYHTDSALWPVIQQLCHAAALGSEDPPDAKLDKLEALLRRAGDQVAATAPLLAALCLLATGERYPPLNLTPQVQKARTLDALVGQIEGLAAHQPVLMILEDAHWIDPTTTELFELVIERVQRLPVLVLITFRPEFNPPWTGHAHVMHVSLSRLARRHGQALVEAVTRGKALPPEVLDQILAKTDGVPLFVEELTKTVVESGLLTDIGDQYALVGPLPPLAIPTTLQDSLMARLDQHAPVKEVAQIAAVIGREFAHQVVAAVSPLPSDKLGEALDQLVASELVFRRGQLPAAGYTFKHALVQDAAYESLLRSRRQQLHARVAQVLEQHFPSTPPEVLAHHCDEAGLTERAVAFWQRAGSRALERSAINEAIAHLNHGLASLVDLPPGRRRDDVELDIQIGLAAAHMAARGYGAEETEHAHMRARELLRGDDPRQFAVLYALFVARWNMAQLHDALATAMELRDRAQMQQDPAPLCVAYRSAAVAQNVLGEFATARQNAVAARELYDPEVHASSALEYGHDIGVAAHLHVALADWFLGFPERAQSSAHQGVRLAEQLGHANTRGYAQFWRCWFRLLARDAPALEADATALVRFADEQFMGNWSAIGRALTGVAQILQGNPRSGIELLDTGIAGIERNRSRCVAHFLKSARAEALAQIGRLEEGLALLQQTLDFAHSAGLHWSEVEHHRLRGILSLQKARPEQEAAEAYFRSAIDVARQQKAKLLELRAATSLAHLWADKGERRKAHDLLAPIYGWFTEGFDTADLKEAKALLNELS